MPLKITFLSIMFFLVSCTQSPPKEEKAPTPPRPKGVVPLTDEFNLAMVTAQYRMTTSSEKLDLLLENIENGAAMSKVWRLEFQYPINSRYVDQTTAHIKSEKKKLALRKAKFDSLILTIDTVQYIHNLSAIRKTMDSLQRNIQEAELSLERNLRIK